MLLVAEKSRRKRGDAPLQCASSQIEFAIGLPKRASQYSRSWTEQNTERTRERQSERAYGKENKISSSSIGSLCNWKTITSLIFIKTTQVPFSIFVKLCTSYIYIYKDIPPILQFLANLLAVSIQLNFVYL